jgi:two-component system cell cycle response regulator
MPWVDGPELIGRIRAAASPAYTYIILLTAKDDKADLVRGLETGADDYLAKPFDRRELLARVGIGARLLDLETRLKEARDQMEALAMQDGLTGLCNRRAIEAQAQAECSRAARDEQPTSVILLDVDHFKAVNDRYGHQIGDQALRLMADVLARSQRGYDVAGRWGGEEFMLVLPETTLEDAGRVAERVRATVAAAALPLSDGTSLEVRVSLGVAGTCDSVPPSADALIRQADEALYQAKRAGRNRVCLFRHGSHERDSVAPAGPTNGHATSSVR